MWIDGKIRRGVDLGGGWIDGKIRRGLEKGNRRKQKYRDKWKDMRYRSRFIENEKF